jgi:alkylation response protein AidB-like acyl-CoA dehydrogenase
VNFDDTPEEAAFRAECRAWLEANAPRRREADRSGVLSVFTPGLDSAEAIVRAHEWQLRKAQAGWAGITWPQAYGGRGGTAMQDIIFTQEEARFDVNAHVFTIGLGLAAPTLMLFGTEEQKQRWLPPMLTGEEIWCQLFSEPDAGSDLASLTTRAERRGDHFVVNGQKVWNSGAHYSRWGMLLARTNPDVPKTKGITWFVLDMEAPGVHVAPLRQMTGGAHFSEVFFDDVRVPVENAVGGVDNGWAVARATLLNERAMLGNVLTDAGITEGLIDLARATRRHGAPAAEDPLVREELARVYQEAATLRYTGYRVLTAISKGGLPGPEAGGIKLVMGDLLARAAGLALELEGPAGVAADSDWQFVFLGAPAMRLGGGTDEILKNVLGEMVLGLPREPAVDRDVPFRDLRARRG